MTQRDPDESVCQNDTSLFNVYFFLITPTSLKMKEAGTGQRLISSRSITKRYFVKLCSFCTKKTGSQSLGDEKMVAQQNIPRQKKEAAVTPKIQNYCTLVHLPTVAAAETTLPALLSCQHRALNPSNKISSHLPPAHISAFYK